MSFEKEVYEKLIDIGDTASKEFGIEKIVDKMQGKFKFFILNNV